MLGRNYRERTCVRRFSSMYSIHVLEKPCLVLDLFVADIAVQGVLRLVFIFLGAESTRSEDLVNQLHLSVCLRVGAFCKRMLIPCFLHRVLPGFWSFEGEMYPVL